MTVPRATPVVAALAAATALAGAGCGGDDEAGTTGGGGAGVASTGATSGTAPSTDAPTQPEPGGGRRGETERARTPESQVDGGPGDEIPASGPADFTGRGGRVGPRVVRVPPFLGIGVTLRSADGRAYGLRVAGRTLRVGGSKRTASVRLEGLRPGRSYAGAATAGNEGKVRIVASAEPGP